MCLSMQKKQILRMQQELIQRIWKKNDLANLKSDVDELDIDKIKNIPIRSRSFEIEVDKLDIGMINLRKKLITLISLIQKI